MLVLLLLLTTVILIVNSMSLVVSNRVFSLSLISLIVVIFVTCFALIFLSSNFGGYASIISDDSLRYVYEANLFKETPYLVDEIHGRYKDYEVTPKMGMSSLLSWVTYFANDVAHLEYYVVNNILYLIVLLIAVCMLSKVCFMFKVKDLVFYTLALFLFVIPFDLYWLVKLLRESMANILMILCLLVSFLYISKPCRKLLVVYFVAYLWLLLFRPQIAVVAGFVFFFTLILARRVFIEILFVSLIMLLGLSQSIATTGYQRLLGVFDGIGLGFISSLLDLLLGDRWILILICTIALFTVLFSNSLKKQYNLRVQIKAFKLGLLIVSILGAGIFFTQDFMQIRFIYPFILVFKLYLVFQYLYRYGDRGRNVYAVT